MPTFAARFVASAELPPGPDERRFRVVFDLLVDGADRGRREVVVPIGPRTAEQFFTQFSAWRPAPEWAALFAASFFFVPTVGLFALALVPALYIGLYFYLFAWLFDLDTLEVGVTVVAIVILRYVVLVVLSIALS